MKPALSTGLTGLALCLVTSCAASSDAQPGNAGQDSGGMTGSVAGPVRQHTWSQTDNTFPALPGHIHLHARAGGALGGR